MTTNAQFIANFFLGIGWTPQSISGMLGNMQSESTINFGIYESLDSSSSTNGFGLVQWTPNTNYFNWADANGYTNDHVNGELYRIKWEVANNQQWISTSSYSMSFQEFTQSTDTPSNLAMAWLYDYERPASLDQPARGTQATNWYNTLDWSGSGGSGGTGGTGGTTGGTTSTTKVAVLMHLLLSDSLNGWKW